MEVTWQGGGIPIGYQYDEENKVLVFDHHFKDVVKTIFNLALSNNATALEIAGELNKRGIKSKRGVTWSYKTISYLFTPKKLLFYAGYQDDNKGNWPAIITKADADSLIKKNVIATASPRPHKNIFLLTGLGLAFCGYCGGRIKTSSTQRKNSVVHYYLCSNKQMRGASFCPNSKVVPQNKLNDKIITSVITQYKNIEEIKKFSDTFQSQSQKNCRAELRTLNNQMSILLNKQSLSKNNTELNRINNEIESLLKKRAQIISEQIIDVDFSELKKINVPNIHRFSIPKQQEIIKAFIKRVIIKRDNITIEFPFIINNRGSKKVSIEL